MAVEPKPVSRNELLWIAAIIMAAIALRFVALGADPLPEISGGFSSDQGTWWKNPRLHAMFGRWTVDDANWGLMTAPAYTLVMRAVFALLGVGYAQAYAANALSGVLTAILVYALVRREADAPPALLAAGFVTFNALLLAYDRSSYPESFQLMMMVACVGGILASRNRVWLAALAGAAATVVVLAKPNGLLLGPVATLTWGALWMSRRARGESTNDLLRGFLAYSAAVAVVFAFVGIVYFMPNRADVLLHFDIQLRGNEELGAGAITRMPFFGSPFGFRLNGFFKWEWYLLIICALFGALRITRTIAQRVTDIEVASWVWLVVGVGFMGLQTYQQDRRFLFVVPPLAMLAGLALGRGIVTTESAWTSLRTRRLAYGAAGLIAALVSLIYLTPYGVWKTMAIGRLIGRTWDYATAGGILLSAMALVVAVFVAWRMPTPRWRLSVRHQIAIASLPMLFIFARSAYLVGSRRDDIAEVSRTLDRISATWPDSERVAAGWASGTMTLGSHVLPVNHETKGPRAALRFQPQFELYMVTPGGSAKHSAQWEIPGRPIKVGCALLPIWADIAGRPRLFVHVFVEPDRVAACKSAVVAQAGSSGKNDGQ